jgi:hypothetical protein
VVGADTVGQHPAVRGVHHVGVAALLYPDGSIAAVAAQPSVTPLLVSSDTHRLMLGAVRSEGQGRVVFKPFVIADADGERFNRQFDAWCERPGSW